MKKKILFGVVFTMTLFCSIAVFECKKQLYILYIRAFNLTTSLQQVNTKGNLDGESSIYENGNLKTVVHFKNGMKDGWMIRYYKGGIIENKQFYKNDKEDGEEYEYFENGSLMYSGKWKMGKRYGDLNYFYKNGRLKIYHAYDILGKIFNIVWFDEGGKLLKTEGYGVSNVIYSFSDVSNSPIILKQRNVYNKIQDLYLTVATPPTIKVNISLSINNKNVEGIKAENNTMKISNAFQNNGIYNLKISEKLTDMGNNILKSDSFEAIIIKGY